MICDTNMETFRNFSKKEIFSSLRKINPRERHCVFFHRSGRSLGRLMRVAEQVGGVNDGEIFAYILLKNGKIAKSPIQLVQELP